ncbi:hypothetical protein [Streptomyces sp. H27-C3]|uniref:hypothetical protein n=1 Tax=Streptomyces sp. H27-C3 TaxID=3046305 RepID=UPI0024BB35DA|nr:hypothetical protein [Streptomyces sp. H27-C3]MDJ0465070.1 hypothetical protein [Streptomyces sp. H27-C3]
MTTSSTPGRQARRRWDWIASLTSMAKGLRSPRDFHTQTWGPRRPSARRAKSFSSNSPVRMSRSSRAVLMGASGSANFSASRARRRAVVPVCAVSVVMSAPSLTGVFS